MIIGQQPGHHFRFIAAFREGRLDFQKKYSESLNPYAIRFIRFDLVVHPFQHSLLHRVVALARIPHIFR